MPSPASKFVVPDFSQEALEALAKGAENHEPVGDLEFLGVELRIINALEQAGITTIDQLLAVPPARLLIIPNIAGKAVQSLLNALVGYHMLKKESNKILKKEMIPARAANEKRKVRRLIGAENETDDRAIALDAEAGRQEAIFRDPC